MRVLTLCSNRLSMAKKSKSPRPVAMSKHHEDFLPVVEGAVPQKRSTVVIRDKKPTVLYIGRIPHGFFEHEMRGFFSQFGNIKRLRISRNKKTGKSKHYGFIEFENPEVAAIVAECMHNYLLFEHVLKVHLLPPEDVHPALFSGCDKKFQPKNRTKIEMKNHSKVRTTAEQERLVKAILKKDAKRRRKIEAAGINYDFPDVVGQHPPTAKKIRFEDDGDKQEDDS